MDDLKWEIRFCGCWGGPTLGEAHVAFLGLQSVCPVNDEGWLSLSRRRKDSHCPDQRHPPAFWFLWSTSQGGDPARCVLGCLHGGASGPSLGFCAWTPETRAQLCPATWCLQAPDGVVSVPGSLAAPSASSSPQGPAERWAIHRRFGSVMALLRDGSPWLDPGGLASPCRRPYPRGPLGEHLFPITLEELTGRWIWPHDLTASGRRLAVNHKPRAGRSAAGGSFGELGLWCGAGRPTLATLPGPAG